MDAYIYIGVLAIIFIVVVAYVFIQVNKNKKPKLRTDLPIDLNLLIGAFGGLDNLKEVVGSPSKVTVFLKDVDLVKVRDLTDLGASGVVQSNDKLTAIFGSFSPLIAEELRKRLDK